jgi:hypothetical protein
MRVDGLIQSTTAKINNVEIAGVSSTEISGSTVYNHFFVREIRVYEDICKPYFTAELVVESLINTHEAWLFPTAEVRVSFECPRSDGKAYKRYNERFRILSYDSVEIGAGGDGRVQHRISCIGQEYFNDKHNIVIENFMNMTETAIARKIHNQFMASNGSLDLKVPSNGLTGTVVQKYEVRNKRPYTAIQEVLDKAYWAQFRSLAPVYFRNKSGYVMTPLENIIKNGSVSENFIHILNAGSNINTALQGYNLIMHIKPVAPPGPATSGVRASEIAGLLKSQSFLEQSTGNLITKFGKKNLGGIKKNAEDMLNEASKGRFGGGLLFKTLTDLLKPRAVNPEANGAKIEQEAFVTSLTYSNKYWITVPGQTGLNVTCGDTIDVIFPVNNKNVQRKLFVPRLIHEIKDNGKDPVEGKTEIYGVYWRS